MNPFLDVIVYEADPYVVYYKNSVNLRELLQKFGEAILKKEKKLLRLLQAQNLQAQIDVTITDAPGIQEINKITRKIDQVTDVLSFTNYQLEPENERFTYCFAPYDLLDPDAPEKRISLGEIVICAEKVQEQAESLEHSYLREFLFLYMHGLLHLCGYDHLNQEQEELMFGLQKSMLEQLNALLESSQTEG